MNRHGRLLLSLLLLLLSLVAAAAPPAPSPRSAPKPAPPAVAFLGDSLTAGLGLPEGEAWPARVGELLAAKGTPIRVINAGVSGDTTAGGLRRVDWVLGSKPRVVVVALGANDGLRGIPPEETEKNLRAIVRKVKGGGVKVLLCGMLLPPSHGEDYIRRFAELFPRVAKSEKVPLLPFLLEGVGGIEALNQEDGIHPTAEGHRKIAALVAPKLAPLLADAAKK